MKYIVDNIINEINNNKKITSFDEAIDEVDVSISKMKKILGDVKQNITDAELLLIENNSCRRSADYCDVMQHIVDILKIIEASELNDQPQTPTTPTIKDINERL